MVEWHAAKQWERETGMIVMTGDSADGSFTVDHTSRSKSLIQWLSDSAGPVKFHEVIASRLYRSWTQISMIMSIKWLWKCSGFFVKLAWCFSGVSTCHRRLSDYLHLIKDSSHCSGVFISPTLSFIRAFNCGISHVVKSERFCWIR